MATGAAVLVSGASFAGLATAYWMNRLGMAITGAARLADALQCHGVDHAAAFQEYDAKLRPFVEDVQEKAVRFGMASMFPSDDAEIAERNRKLGEGGMEL